MGIALAECGMSSSVATAQKSLTRSTLDRAVLVLYLTSLALLPWAWFPPFPWLHEHAQSVTHKMRFAGPFVLMLALSVIGAA